MQYNLVFVKCAVLMRCVRGVSYLLHQWHDDDEGGGDEGPAPGHDGPDVELGQVEQIHGEHRSRPDADEEGGEEEAGDVGCDLGSTELADHDLEGWAVVEVGALLKVQLTLEEVSGSKGIRINRYRIYFCAYKIG